MANIIGDIVKAILDFFAVNIRIERNDPVATEPKQVKESTTMGQLSENFRLQEFKCRHCGKTAHGQPPAELIDLLERVRARFGKPVTIMSGYRCPTHNAAVGGAANSRHMYGDAADIVVEDTSADEVYHFADAIVGSKGGVGRYQTFTHIDVRGYKARW